MASDGQNIMSVTGGGGFFALAASTLCFYEHAITFNDEVRCVWQRRISRASVLFLLNRYAILVVSLSSIVQVIPWDVVLPEGFDSDINNPPGDTGIYGTVCTTSLRTVDTCLIIASITYTVFAGLRMYALYGMRKSVFIMVFAIGLLNPGAQMFRMIVEGANANWSYATAVENMPLGRLNCFHSVRNEYRDYQGIDFERITGYVFFAIRAHALIFEGILIVLTWHKTFNQWKMRKSTIRTPYTRLLLRNGTMYFVAIALASAINLVGAMTCLLMIGPDKNNTPLFALLSTSILVDTITSICMSRFILGLLGLSLDDSDLQFHSSQWKTLRFATTTGTMVEGLGADLQDLSVEDEEDAKAEVESAAN